MQFYSCKVDTALNSFQIGVTRLVGLIACKVLFDLGASGLVIVYWI